MANSKSFRILILVLLAALSIHNESYGALSKDQAMQVALQEIKGILQFTQCGRWTNATIVSDAFPIYLDGISAISYYECKAITNGLDAGYVLVDVNQTDYLIVESCPTGPTLFEQYKVLLGNSSFIVCRYDPLRSVALDPNSKAVLASKGFLPLTQTKTGLRKTLASSDDQGISDFAVQFRALKH
jgi:hypothetical protein